MRDEEFPAAHSMDTEWFAVDADGHVGVFDSGEGGPVPIERSRVDARDLVRRLVLEAPGHLWATGAVRDRHCWRTGERPEWPDLYGVVLFLRTPPDWPLDPHETLNVAEPFASSDGPLYAVYADSLDEDVFDQLHQAGLCAGCGGGDVGQRAHRGLFQYACDGYDLEPYSRTGSPAGALRAADLPPLLRELAEQFRLNDVRFADAQRLQPLEHVPCDLWGKPEDYGTFGSSDGQTRVPFPPKSK